MSFVERLKSRARQLRQETFALYLAARHPDTPWYAKLLAAAVAAYAFSPIDLIPDFIPVLGYVDDLVLVPAGIALAVRLVPAVVMDECRERARTMFDSAGPSSRTAATVVVVIWLLAGVLVVVWALARFG